MNVRRAVDRREPPGYEQARSPGPATSSMGPLHDSPGMALQRRQIAAAFGPRVLQPKVAQLGKGDGQKGGEQGGGKDDKLVSVGKEENALVAARNVEQNRQLLASAFSKLPKRVQDYLLKLQSQLSGEGDAQALVVARRRNPFIQVLGMDPAIFATVLLGLKVMPDTEMLPDTLPGLRDLFFSLATARYSLDTALPMLENGDPVQVAPGESRGVEHVQASCYAASILNLIAAVPAYRRLFDSSVNVTPPDGEARLVQNTIAPMLRTLGGNGTVPAGQVRQLLAVLDGLGLLHGGVGEQQDASQVLMGILQRVQPQRDQLRTAHTVEYDNPDAQNVDGTALQSQAVLQLTAVGHATLEAALVAYFGNERRAGGDVARPHNIRTRAVRFPAVLSIGMLRQSGRDHIDMPEVFRVPAAISGNGRPGPRYRLQAFIVRNTFSHYSGGHYVAVMRDGQGGWAEADDMGEGKKDEPGVMTPRTRAVDVNAHAIGGHAAPAYALATLYTYVLDDDQAPNAPDRTSFGSAWTLGEDVISESIFQSGRKLGPKEIQEREKLTRDFLAKGGSRWDAFDLLRNARNNSALASAFELYLATGRGSGPRAKRSREEVVAKNKYYLAFKDSLTGDLVNLTKNLPQLIAKGFKEGVEQLEAAAVLLKEREEQLRGADYGLCFSDENKDGTKLEIYATGNLIKAGGKLGAWMDGVSRALLGAGFIASRRPPLLIRIRLRPGVTHDIASTSSVGNRVTINLDDYQVAQFTLGQTIGLLAHEIGVHSLDNSTLSPKEQEAEAKDKASKQTGRHGEGTFTVGADPKLEKQQDDHLTIGRGLLGQISALPRLNMYESTLISLLEALPPKDRWDCAAAYCIDIARILVNNDDPTAMMSGIGSKASGANAIATTAAAEWQRMRAKHAKNPVVNSIEISWWGIFKALFTLASLLSKVAKEAKK
jgi:hypothetical protein